MISGIGLDIIEVARIQKATDNQRFFTRNFTDKEIAMFQSRRNDPQVVAGNFAAKEAILKCLHSGLFDIPLIDIEVLRYDSGQPYAILHGEAKKCADSLGVHTIHVSITHIKELAAAQAIAEKL